MCFNIAKRTAAPLVLADLKYVMALELLSDLVSLNPGFGEATL